MMQQQKWRKRKESLFQRYYDSCWFVWIAWHVVVCRNHHSGVSTGLWSGEVWGRCNTINKYCGLICSTLDFFVQVSFFGCMLIILFMYVCLWAIFNLCNFVLETFIPNINYAGLVAFNNAAARIIIPSILNTLFLMHLYLT